MSQNSTSAKVSRRAFSIGLAATPITAALSQTGVVHLPPRHLSAAGSYFSLTR